MSSNTQSPTVRDAHTVWFPVAVPPEHVDVLVVGAGPVGLSAAVELSERGVDVAVVERATSATLVRAGAMGHTARVVEHFRRWGLLQRIREAWTFPPEWNRGIRLRTSLAGHDLVPLPRPSFHGGAASRHSAEEALRRPQTVLQQVFLDRLEERSVAVSAGWEVAALTERGDGVEVALTDIATGEGRVVRAAYVLGADGANSTVRRLAGIEREGERATEKRLRLVVRASDLPDRLGPVPEGTSIVFNAVASGFVAAISPDEWRVYAGPYPLDHDPAEAELLAVARAAFGIDDLGLELVSATTFHNATRIAEAFRRGRILLAGDAAHVRTPGGNLGEGFGDVVNLGWKLAAVLDGHAPDALLDTYDEERRPHNRRVAEHSLDRARRGEATLAELRAGGFPADDDRTAAAEARRAAIGARLAEDRPGGAGITFDERYDASAGIWYEEGQESEEPWRADVYDDDPRPGHRAPDGFVDPYGTTLYDRIGHGFALLVLDGGRAVEAELLAAAARRRVPLAVVHLAESDAGEVYGAGSVLVRPDQHVAWRGTRLPPGGADAVLDRVLGGAVRGGDAPSPDRGVRARA